MLKYKPTIGLEIHAELKTESKMFCSCKNDTSEVLPNVNVCPVCLGHPGTLPVPNRKAIESVLKVGLALGGTLADFSEFDRKNYFYPDIPKGYQISQYKYPLVTGGSLLGVSIKRIHLEEDTAKSFHEMGNYSLIDYNRAGVPLMELVTEPVIKLGKEASAFAKELQLILRTLEVAEVNMEKGEMRVEANISVSDNDKFGTKVEVKNLNSFKALERAIDYEINRQSDLLSRGEKVIQETRGWDDAKQKTFSQREKEESHDYRYFPDPDIPKIQLSISNINVLNLRESLPEMPEEKRKKYTTLGIKKEDANVLVSEERLGKIFSDSLRFLGNDKNKAQLLANYIVSDLAGLANNRSEIKISPEKLAVLISMLSDGLITSRAAKDLLATMVDKDIDPRKEAESRGIIQQSDPNKLFALIQEVIKENLKAVSDYKAGKTGAIGFLVGMAMKKSKGSSNPEVLKDLLEKEISR